MSSQASVLARKIYRAAPARAPLAGISQLARDFARSTGDALRPALNTGVTASVASASVMRLDQITGSLQSRSMLGQVGARGAEMPALIAVYPELVSHLVEISLGGDPDDDAGPLLRAPTAVDCVLCRPHLDIILDALAATLAPGPGPERMFRFTGQRQSLSQLQLPPGSTEVLALEISLNIGPAGRNGSFHIALPLETVDALKRQVPGKTARADDPWQAVMRAAAANAPVQLNAVLHRQKLSLAELRDLETGQVLEIPAQAPENVELTLVQPGGRSFAAGLARLGACEGGKVLKLSAPPARNLAAHLERLVQQAPARPDPPQNRQEDPRPEPEESETAPQDPS